VIDHRVLCPQCSGSREAYVRYGKNYIKSVCPLCKGTGMAHMHTASAWLVDGKQGRYDKHWRDMEEEE
jgi:DnaJ-class molecular chaperone